MSVTASNWIALLVVELFGHARTVLFLWIYHYIVQLPRSGVEGGNDVGRTVWIVRHCAAGQGGPGAL